MATQRGPLVWCLILGTVLCGGLATTATAQLTSLPFDFVDVADDNLAPDHCGINFTYLDLYVTDYAEVGGASMADFDNDGFIDIFFPQTAGGRNRLFKNQGDGTFTDVAVSKGVHDLTSGSCGGLFIDYDHDGDLDLFVASHMGMPSLPLGPPFKLFRNKGEVGEYGFSDVTSTAGFVLGATSKATLWGWMSGACAGDYDQDGWVDLFVGWHGAQQSQDQWRLLRNAPNPAPGDPEDPDYTPRIFVDVTLNSGLEGEFGGNPWQAMFWDINRDGYPDLHIAQDNSLDLMYINNQDGTFTNVATAIGLNGDPPEFRNEMGTALGDPDNDFDHELHTTNVGNEDRYYRNDSIQGALSFTDTAVETGLENCVFGWGTSFFDMDNDGDVDHAAVSGFEHDPFAVYANPVHLNMFPERMPNGLDLEWEDVSHILLEFSKVDTPNGDSTRGLAVGDIDNDGDMDMVVTRNNARAGVYLNTLQSQNGWLAVDLVNTGGSLDTTGSRVTISQAGKMQMRELFTGSSYLCQESPRLHFGLGPAEAPYKTRNGKVAGDGPASMGPGGFTDLTPGPASGPPADSTLELHPRWLVVMWPDGAYQIVLDAKRNTVHKVTRSAVNDAGDMNADGHLTAEDQAMLLLATQDAAAFADLHPFSPGLVVGDINGDGVLDRDDYTAWSSLPPH
ncbi:MAG: CRTAC1 family protein [Planctomycetota bacterium]|jgi:hypothetical protein